MYGWLATLGMGVIVLFLWNANNKLNREIGILETNVKIAEQANEANQTDINRCEEINRENTELLDSALLQGLEAEGRVQVMAILLQEAIRDQISDTEAFQDSDCMSVLYPQSFRDSLCVTGSGNC